MGSLMNVLERIFTGRGKIFLIIVIVRWGVIQDKKASSHPSQCTGNT